MQSTTHRVLLFHGLLTLALLVSAVLALPIQESGEAEAAEPSTASDSDDLRALTLPGDNHQHLQAIVGEWETELKIWLSPEAEPIVATGEAESHWILGGRFVETTYRAEFMGRPFEGRGVEGYDNHAAEYVGTWRDTMGTYTMLYKGQCEEDCRVRTMVAQFTEPLSGRQLTARTVTTVLDDANYRLESFLVAPDGKSFKNLEITARRKQ